MQALWFKTFKLFSCTLPTCSQQSLSKVAHVQHSVKKSKGVALKFQQLWSCRRRRSDCVWECAWVDLMHRSSTGAPQTQQGVSLHQTRPGTLLYSVTISCFICLLRYTSQGAASGWGLHMRLLNLKACLTITGLSFSRPAERGQPWVWRSRGLTQKHKGNCLLNQ